MLGKGRERMLPFSLPGSNAQGLSSASGGALELKQGAMLRECLAEPVLSNNLCARACGALTFESARGDVDVIIFPAGPLKHGKNDFPLH